MTLTFVPDTETLVVVTNVGDQPFVGWKMPGPPVELAPGQSRRVSVDWARTWFGDERSRADAYVVTIEDERIGIAPRSAELLRLQTLYGATAYPERWVKGSAIFTRPECEVHTLEGERVVTVIDDPDGLQSDDSPQTSDDRRLVNDELIALRRKIEVLEGLQARGDDAVPPMVRERDLPRDHTPDAPPPAKQAARR